MLQHGRNIKSTSKQTSNRRPGYTPPDCGSTFQSDRQRHGGDGGPDQEMNAPEPDSHSRWHDGDLGTCVSAADMRKALGQQKPNQSAARVDQRYMLTGDRAG